MNVRERNQEGAKKMVTCQSVKPRRARLIIGARLEAMTWVRTKGTN